MKYPIPSTPADWLDEIRLAFEDAEEMAVAGGGAGEPATDAETFALALLVALNFRGAKLGDAEIQRVREAAIENYTTLVSERTDEASEQNPTLTFAYSYVSAHVSLGLLDEEEAVDILAHCEQNLNGN